MYRVLFIDLSHILPFGKRDGREMGEEEERWRKRGKKTERGWSERRRFREREVKRKRERSGEVEWGEGGTYGGREGHMVGEKDLWWERRTYDWKERTFGVYIESNNCTFRQNTNKKNIS